MSKSVTAGEVDDIPGALDLDVGLPRLVGCGPGRLSFTQYNHWRLRRGEKWVAVEARVSTLREWAWFLAVLAILIAAAEYAVLHFVPPSGDRAPWAMVAPLLAGAVFIAATVIQWIGVSAVAKGEIFRYSADDAMLYLPRINQAIPRHQIVRLDLISGTWRSATSTPAESIRLRSGPSCTCWFALGRAGWCRCR